MKSLILLFAGAVCAFSQPFGVGIKAGVPLTDFVDTARTGNFGYFYHPKRYLVGATAELRLPFGLAVEFDAIYRRLDVTGSGTDITGGTTTASITANRWEFPLLGKYRFGHGPVRPYVDAGIAWDTLQGVEQTVTRIVAGSPASQPNLGLQQETTTTGFVTGIGVDVHAIFLHVTPEIRYTRWGAKHFFDPNGLLSSNQNQAEFMVGISF